MATSYDMDTAGLESRGRQAFLSAPKWSRPSMQYVTRFLSGGEAAGFVKLAEHSPLSRVMVKNECSCTSSPPVCLRGAESHKFLKDQSTAQRVRFNRQVFISGTVRKCCVCYYTGLLFPRCMSRKQYRWYVIWIHRLVILLPTSETARILLYLIKWSRQSNSQW